MFETIIILIMFALVCVESILHNHDCKFYEKHISEQEKIIDSLLAENANLKRDSILATANQYAEDTK